MDFSCYLSQYFGNAEIGIIFLSVQMWHVMRFARDKGQDSVFEIVSVSMILQLSAEVLIVLLYIIEID